MNFKQQNYSIKTLKLLSNANRLKILNLLMEEKPKQLSVCIIAQKLELEANTVSNQLIKLRENGILRSKQDGTNMLYEIKDYRIIEIISLLKKQA